MDYSDKEEVPMLSNMYMQKNENMGSQSRKLSTRTRSASMSAPRSPMENNGSESNYTGPLRSSKKPAIIQMSGPIFTSHKHENHNETKHKTIEPTVDIYSSLKGLSQDGWPENHGAKNEHLLRSGPLGMCSDPYCTTCPLYYNGNRQKYLSKYSLSVDPKFQNVLYGDAKGWAKRICSHLLSYVPGVMNPHNKKVQQWNKFLVISCLFAIFLDPLFFFLLSVQKENKCIVINLPFTTTLVSLRTLTDFIFFINMLLQFRLAYIAPESRVVGAGELVDLPKKIALNYLKGYFVIDFFVVLPLPQIIIVLVIPRFVGSSGANYAKNLLRAAVLIQYIPRLCRFLPFFIGQSPSGFIFESAWANFVINLLTFVLSGHIIGSLWYLFGLQRVNQCLRDACDHSSVKNCKMFIDCGHGNNIQNYSSNTMWKSWKSNENATACFDQGEFAYGIYAQAVNLTTKSSIATRYIYALFWGFQQISTLAGNQVPSYFIWEVLFTMAIIGVGLLLFALLIGNMQNFLQALGRRRVEMSLRRRDVEQWMSHRRLPEDLRRQVRQAERYNWAATRGVNEEFLLEKLPEDLQIEIRRHLFNSIKKVHIFAMMDEPILDAICAKLRQRTYIKGSRILNCGGLIEKMVFIVRGKMESIGEDNIKVPLSEGNVCGEELLTWCLEHSSVNRDGKKVRLPGPKLLSNRTVMCLTNVEAFTLRAVDLEEVTSLFSRFLRNSRVQGALRYDSPYWRCLAANRIQVAWRYMKKRIQRAETSRNNHEISTPHL